MFGVAVLGASSNPDRYSFKALKLLSEMGYRVYPVHPSGKSVDDIECFTALKNIPDEIHTITVYLSEKNSTPIIEDIIRVNPRRVILNPGAENKILAEMCKNAGIEVLEACTLVLLRTGQF